MTTLNVKLEILSNKNKVPSARSKDSALVLGMATLNSRPKALKTVEREKIFAPAIEALQRQASFEGHSGTFISLLDQKDSLSATPTYQHLIGMGIGTSQNFYPQNVLHWGGKLIQLVRALKIKEVDVVLDSIFNPSSSAKAADAPKDFASRPALGGIMNAEQFLEKFALGIFLGAYKFNLYKSKKKSDKDIESIPVIRFHFKQVDDKKATAILNRAQIIAEGVYLTRDLQTIPGGDLPPAEIAKRAQEAGRKARFNVTVFDEKRLKTEGMNGILTVGKGSECPPRFIILEHNAAKKTKVPTLVLIGKGISFDTGGISIKPALGMEEMKMDMSGSAAVIGAVSILARLKTPVHVVGLIASAENMPSGSAVRPGDIFAAHDGQTVEVLNTDAEGRLVLADALSYAKKYNPDAVIDIATLTGAVIIALGHVSSGVMGNNAQLIEGVRKASDRAGEKTWELPLYEDFEDQLKSKVADYKNIGNGREAGSSMAGVFLNFFVKGAYPWVHMDVAGTADTPRGQGAHSPPDVGTAVPVRALVEFAENFEEYFPRKKTGK